jgi:hypothetical protein
MEIQEIPEKNQYQRYLMLNAQSHNEGVPLHPK